MNIFPGFGDPKAFGSNPETVANTKALNLRNEQFATRQTQRTANQAARTERRDARDLTRRQNTANEVQNNNKTFKQIVRPEAANITPPAGASPATTSSASKPNSSSSNTVNRRRNNRRVRRGR